MARIIAFASAKGGVGKSTSCGTIGFLLAVHDKRVLLVDLDSQGSLSSSVGGKRSADLYRVLRRYVEDGHDEDLTPFVQQIAPNVGLLGNGPIMANLDVVMAKSDAPSRMLHSIFAVLMNVELRAGENYDYILLDCPPSMSRVTMAALIAATDVLVPVIPEKMALDGLAMMLTTISKIKKSHNPYLHLAGVIPTMVEDTDVQRAMLATIRQIADRFNITPLRPIPRRTGVQQAVGMGKPITKHRANRGCREVADAYDEIVQQLIAEE